MGIDVRVYTMYGVKIDWDEQLMDDYDDIYQDCTADLVMDGMNGEFVVLGAILFSSENFRWNSGEGTANMSISMEDLPGIESEYRKNFARWFPDHVGLLDGQKFMLQTFTHYS